MLLQGAAVKVMCALWSWHVGAIRRVNASSAHIESESPAHIANESSPHRETASSAHKERSSAHIDAGNQPFRVWLGGVGGS